MSCTHTIVSDDVYANGDMNEQIVEDGFIVINGVRVFKILFNGETESLYTSTLQYEVEKFMYKDNMLLLTNFDNDYINVEIHDLCSRNTIMFNLPFSIYNIAYIHNEFKIITIDAMGVTIYNNMGEEDHHIQLGHVLLSHVSCFPNSDELLLMSDNGTWWATFDGELTEHHSQYRVNVYIDYGVIYIISGKELTILGVDTKITIPKHCYIRDVNGGRVLLEDHNAQHYIVNIASGEIEYAFECTTPVQRKDIRNPKQRYHTTKFSTDGTKIYSLCADWDGYIGKYVIEERETPGLTLIKSAYKI